MQNIDKLITIAKCLFDVRISQQRGEIEDLKKEIKNNPNDLNRYYLVFFINQDCNCEMTIIQTLSEGDEFKTISEMDDIKPEYEDFISQGGDLDIIGYVKLLIENNDVVLIKLDLLKTHLLLVNSETMEVITKIR